MVKTRHSDEFSPQLGPQFLSLNNERHQRHSTRAADDAGDSLHTSRAYTEGSNAFNIFQEKVVESRLRPRTGPSHAYNYLDADWSEEESRYRSRHMSGRRGFSPKQRDGSSHRLRQRQLKAEMLEEEMQESRRSGGSLRRLRGVSPESEKSDHDIEASERGEGSSRSKLRGGRVNMENAKSVYQEREGRRSLRRAASPEAEDSEKEFVQSRQVRSSRGRQPQEQQSSDEEQEEKAELTTSRVRSSRRQTVIEQEHDDDDEREEDEEECVRRSSRKRRPVFDTLNQSYLVSMPGRRKQNAEEAQNDDTKDEDSDNQDDDCEKKEYSDMYSRVKRKRVHVKRNMYGVPVNDESDSNEEDQDENTNNNNDDEEDDDDEDEEEEEEREGDMENKNVNQSRRVLRNRRNLRRTQPQQRIVKSYSLRQHKPTIDRYKPPEEKRRVRKVDNSVFASTPTKNNPKQTYQSPAQRRNIRKRSAFHSSSSSTSSSDSESSDEKNFKRRKAKSMAKARNRMMPMNMTADALASASVLKDRVKSGVSLADVEPMNIDKSVTFNSIGGLGKHIRKLKEMVVFPLLYDNVFQRFKVDPPRGVLFYGPPGTGKTLVARALANECSQGDRRVAFFMRKGADCLSKWVGESERQLRLLFDQAYKFRPSIIFFDEIDGLAPVRSSRQDQIHSSIVSTLLALMDGLDCRGEIVVIGATNRIDSLDPALRRPGRFDREFLFPLPSVEARKQILQIHTNSWNPRLNDHFLSELAEKCVGYCGADLKALCTEAAMQALRRRYPQIYLTNEALKLDVSSINVSAKDFFNGIANIVPTSQRSVNTPARALASRVAPLLQPQLDSVMDKLADIFPASQAEGSSHGAPANLSQAKALAEKSGIPWDELLSDEDENAPSIFMPSTPTKGNSRASKGASLEPGTSVSVSTYLNFASYATCRPTTFRPRLMLVGSEGQGQTTHLAPAVVHQMENLPIHVLDLPTLYAVTAKTPEESCANVFHEAKRKVPSILYLPYMDQWWDVMADTLRATLLTLIQDLDPALPLLLLATSERPYHMLDPTLRSLFSSYSCEVSVMRNPGKDERHTFFEDLLLRQAFKPPPQKKQAEALLNLLKETEKPTTTSKCVGRRRKFKRSKQSKQSSALPNFIYPFGRHDDGACLRGKSVETADLETDPSHVGKSDVSALKSFDVVSKLADVRVKLRDGPDVNGSCAGKHSHRMVLRSRVHATGGLNSNQSARESGFRLACQVRRSSCPALKPMLMMRRIRPQGPCAKSKALNVSTLFSKPQPKMSKTGDINTQADAGEVFDPHGNASSLNQEDTFKKPIRAPLKMKCSQKKSLSATKNSRNIWGRLSNELTSRHERYVRRLHRLEEKMSKIVTNPHSSESLDSQASYCALSARHLRYLRRLRKIDTALLQAKSHCLVGHSSHLKDERKHRSRSALSCGSVQMLYKKRSNVDCFDRNLSLPLNLRDLVGKQRRALKHGRSCGKNVLKHIRRNLTSGKACEEGPYNLRKRKTQRAHRMLESLPLATAAKPRDLSPEEMARLVEKEELTLMELRIFLRDVLNKLGTDKKFSIFAKPVNIEDAADYYDIIETPMDLSSMMAKIDLHEYSTVRDFLNDVDLICSNALEYNPDRGPMDRVIRHRACALKDTAYAIIKTELDKEFEKSCVEIQESRKRRGEKSGTVPNFYNTKLKHGNSSASRGQAPNGQSSVPSYLEKPQPQRSIPKPDGERFSRRVRGLNTDPVPPLEAVEKVYKSSREDKNNSSNSLVGGGDEVEQEQKFVREDKQGEEGDETVEEKDDIEKLSLDAAEDCLNKDDKVEKIVHNTLTATASTGKKKRPACVWCRPKRKRPRTGGLLKSGEKYSGAEKRSVEDEEEKEAEEEMSVEEEEEVEEEEVGDTDKTELDQQLAVDTSEITEVKSSRGKVGRPSRSPVTSLVAPGGVATRRSSLSPRLSAASPLSQPAAASSLSPVQQPPSSSSTAAQDCQKEDKVDTSEPCTELSNEDNADEEKEKAIEKTKALLAPRSTTSKDFNSVPDKTIPEMAQASDDFKDKPRAVKRLDLDLIITDSGHGSSLESNGDSRDSTDQKGSLTFPGTKEISALGALVNSNHNCSEELRTTATAILQAPSQTVMADVPRMTQLLTRLVSRTEGQTVERLEKIYSHLSQVIYRHRHAADKAAMMEAMERKVEDLTQTMPSTSKH